MIFHCGLILISLISDVKHLFMCLTVYLLWKKKKSLWSSAHFKLDYLFDTELCELEEGSLLFSFPKL